MTVKDRIGTLEGVLTVRVDSRNPKTADGFNTFIFRRPVEESLQGQSRIGESAKEKSKADSEVTSLQGQTRIGESAFDAVYDNRFRLILQGVAAYFDSCQEERMRLSQELWLGKLSGETRGWISQSEIEQHFKTKGII